MVFDSHKSQVIIPYLGRWVGCLEAKVKVVVTKIRTLFPEVRGFFFSPFIVAFWGFGNLSPFPEVIIFRIFVGVPYFCSTCGCWDHSFGHV